MKIILSRKGFDSTSGGTPSPILPDGRMVSFPIPDKQSPIRYSDIRWQEFNLGLLVFDLTRGRIPPSHHAHLDPDLSHESLPRSLEWKPIFGQTGAAQGHLRKCGVQENDVFLFFGLFRQVVCKSGKLEWDNISQPRHVLWGWLQIGKVLNVEGHDKACPDWVEYHPHLHRSLEKNNTVYLSKAALELPGANNQGIAGAGVFPNFSNQIQLTVQSATTPSTWALPRWFYPKQSGRSLTYSNELSR